MKIVRRKTKIIKIGNTCIGGNFPVAIQSMVKCKIENIAQSISEISKLENAGCEIVRLAIKDMPDAKAIRKIKKETRLPLVADIHFNWQLAIAAIDSGVDKIRLNPGNIYKKEEVREIVKVAKLAGIPIRVGMNSGSLRGRRLQVAGHRSIADQMVKSALGYIRILEGFKFDDIVVSLKASNTLDTIEAYRKISKACAYPLHLGLTATGLPFAGRIKSSIAIGSLLLDGIGDTIRVSLTESPLEEVKVAKAVLEALGLRFFGPEVISCPTCGRCEVDLVKIVKNLENRLSQIRHRSVKHQKKLAVMGCVVNGPGEACQADVGIAFGKKEGLLFKKSHPVKKVNFRECESILLKESL